MIEICPKCRNYEWDKEITGEKIRCPKCGEEWDFISMPLYILTGCSGVGKTTTAVEIVKKKVDYAVLDADILTWYVDWNNEEHCNDWVEMILNLTKDINQSGRPVLWTMAGCIDRLSKAYNSRYFSEIKCLALVCEDEALRKRMQEGRGITDENWIKGSGDYNRYFMEHDSLGDTKFETFDITDKEPCEVAEYVMEWMSKFSIDKTKKGNLRFDAF